MLQGAGSVRAQEREMGLWRVGCKSNPLPVTAWSGVSGFLCLPLSLSPSKMGPCGSSAGIINERLPRSVFVVWRLSGRRRQIIGGWWR